MLVSNSILHWYSEMTFYGMHRMHRQRAQRHPRFEGRGNADLRFLPPSPLLIISSLRNTRQEALPDGRIDLQACKLKFRLRELTSCLCSAAASAVCFEGCLAGPDATVTGNERSQPKFEFTSLLISHAIALNDTRFLSLPMYAYDKSQRQLELPR